MKKRGERQKEGRSIVIKLKGRAEKESTGGGSHVTPGGSEETELNPDVGH